MSKKEMKLYLLTSISNERKKIYRYKCDYFGNTNMWRESEQEAKNDIQRKFINWQDKAKGIKEMFLLEELEEYEKENKDLLN